MTGVVGGSSVLQHDAAVDSIANGVEPDQRFGSNSSIPIPMEAPGLNSVHEGRVARVEDYGAFVQFGRHRGLVHISELASMRVEKVTDVVEVDETVWVRVLDVEDTGGRYPKIRLSMKNVPQDGSAPQVLEATQQAEQVKNTLEQNLHSTMGMAIARDPMAPSNNRGLVLKEPKVIKGYALLLDDEEEQPAARPTVSAPAPAVKSAGRGRGMTIPAWMAKANELGTSNRDDDDHKKDKKAKKSKKRKKREDRKEERRRRRHRSPSSDENSRGRDRRKRHKRSYSSDNEEFDGHRRRKSRQSRRKDDSGDDSSSRGHRRHKNRRRHHSSSGSESESGGRRHYHDKQREPEFTSVEEARRLVEEIEARRRGET